MQNGFGMDREEILRHSRAAGDWRLVLILSLLLAGAALLNLAVYVRGILG